MAYTMKKTHSRKRNAAPPGGAAGEDHGGDVTMTQDFMPSSWDPTHHPNPHHRVGAVSQQFEPMAHNSLRSGYFRGPEEYPQVVHDVDLDEDGDWDMCNDI